MAHLPRSVFAVFSDDLDGCRDHLSRPDVMFVDDNPDWFDLYVMARCDHHIIVNSTYSWWSAYLNRIPDRRVIGKVFGVGMFKTGTTSFGTAMEVLGLTSRYRFWQQLTSLPAYFDLDPRQFMPFEVEIRREADRYDSFADAPWLYLFRELDRWYPDSRFVPILRKSSTDLVESELRMWQRRATAVIRLEHGTEPVPFPSLLDDDRDLSSAAW